MGMTITEKILAAHADREVVRPGEIINARVDLLLCNELSSGPAIEEFRKIRGAGRVFDPEKIIMVPDHFIPNKDIASAILTKTMRDFAREQGVIYYEVGRAGIEHVLLPELGLVVPGDLVVGADSHTCTYGALGAFATGVGSTDAAATMALGEAWLKVPSTIKVVYRGTPGRWVGGKDLILYTIGKLGVDGARYQALEFTGDAVCKLTMADRFSMANMAIEAGAKNGIFAPDVKTVAYARAASTRPFQIYESDPDAEYSQVLDFDVNAIEPQVAFPHLPENSRPVSQVGEVPIDQVVIGSCTNGRLEDLRIAAGILKGRRVHPSLRAIVIPGSQKVYVEALREGLIESFVEAGCAVSTPTCGPCLGGHVGVLAEGERCVATTNRNFVGRMGHPRSEVYLAGPAVAASSAVAGRVAGPDDI
ncbi:MAG: 3-isopropylmalate dehydratase large subunit [Chloroflexi bacterium]|nr:3-isopropylmalate dehydratase large subunit [Chloroflexota bacterium]